MVFGSLAGEWLSVRQGFGVEAGFWLGHQGYEYVDLGRFWQVRQDTGCVNTIEWADGRWALRQANDLSHLRGLTPDRRDF